MAESNHTDLSDEEQHITGQRIIYDARLLQDGATINRAGGVALSETQLQLAALTDDPLWEDYRYTRTAPAEVTLQNTWLDQPLSALYQKPYKRMDLPRLLSNSSIDSVRDLLVAGRVQTGRIRNLGAKALAECETMVAQNEFGLEWKDEPTVHDIASFSQLLHQVNAKALAKADYPESIKYFDFAGRVTVQDILDTDPKDAPQLLRVANHNGGQWIAERDAKVLLQAAKLFGAEFERIQDEKYLTELDS